jgi:hypothetical protein
LPVIGPRSSPSSNTTSSPAMAIAPSRKWNKRKGATAYCIKNALQVHGFSRAELSPPSLEIKYAAQPRSNLLIYFALIPDWRRKPLQPSRLVAKIHQKSLLAGRPIRMRILPSPRAHHGVPEMALPWRRYRTPAEPGVSCWTVVTKTMPFAPQRAIWVGTPSTSGITMELSKAWVLRL